MEIREAIDELSSCHPRLQSALRTFEDEYGSDLPVVSFGTLGSAVVEHLDVFEDDQLAKIFERADQLLNVDDETTKNGVATGFLESVVNGGEANGSINQLRKHFGPNATAYLESWNQFLGIDEAE